MLCFEKNLAFRLISSMFAQALIELTPYKKLSYIQNYFQTILLIMKDGDPLRTYRIKFVIWYQLLECLRYAYLNLFPLTNLDRIVWYDAVFLFGLKNSGNIMALFVHLMVAYFYQMLYVDNHAPSIELLRQVLFEKRTDFFPQPYIRDQPIYKIIQRITMFYFSTFQLFVVALDFFMLTSFYLSVHFIVKYWFYFADLYSTGLARIALLHFNVLFFNFGLVIFAHSCIMMATLFIVSTKVIFIKLNQLSTIVECKLTKDLINERMPQYVDQHTQTLVMVLEGNHFFGTAFLLYFVVNVPFNVFLVMSIILLRHLSAFKLFFLYCMAAQQFIFIFGIHLMCAMYTKKIHQNSKQLMHLNVNAPCQTLETRIKLDCYIQKFHTKKCYGVTYGRFGLITFRAFFKYLLIYAKFLMITYKILIKN